MHLKRRLLLRSSFDTRLAALEVVAAQQIERVTARVHAREDEIAGPEIMSKADALVRAVEAGEISEAAYYAQWNALFAPCLPQFEADPQIMAISPRLARAIGWRDYAQRVRARRTRS